jgi:hypothetical protein
LIVENANTSYHPDRYRDLDLAEFTRQTVIFKDLWSIYEALPHPDHDSVSTRLDRFALRDAIEKMQKILFPWITNRGTEEPGIESFFDLVDSFTEDSGIVLSTGKGGFRWAVHQITTLRNVLNCQLPIEMYPPTKIS